MFAVTLRLRVNFDYWVYPSTFIHQRDLKTWMSFLAWQYNDPKR